MSHALVQSSDGSDLLGIRALQCLLLVGCAVATWLQGPLLLLSDMTWLSAVVPTRLAVIVSCWLSQPCHSAPGPARPGPGYWTAQTV